MLERSVEGEDNFKGGGDRVVGHPHPNVMTYKPIVTRERSPESGRQHLEGQQD